MTVCVHHCLCAFMYVCMSVFVHVGLCACLCVCISEYKGFQQYILFNYFKGLSNTWMD